MAVDNSPHDNDLLAALAAAIAAAQPMPASIVELGRAAWDARALDAEFAELVGDSLMDEELAEGYAIRGGGSQPRMLSFAAGDVAIELELGPAAGGAQHIVGQLLPPGPAAIVLEREDGSTEHVEADEDGRFELAGATPGPARLQVLRTPDGPLTSAWFRL
jgi:hypothetical protein